MQSKMHVLIFMIAASVAPALAQGQAPCDNPQLEFMPDKMVTSDATIKWRPPHCVMVIETWRNGTDCWKIGVTDSSGAGSTKARPCNEAQGLQDAGVHSGDLTIRQARGNQDQKGNIVIKIWVPNKGIVKAVSVYVR